MRLSKIAILVIKGSSPAIVKKLAAALVVSDATIYRYVNDEEDDNLTKAAALAVIREETGLADEEILEQEEPTAKA